MNITRLFLLSLLVWMSATAAAFAEEPKTADQYNQQGWQHYRQGSFELAIVQWLDAAALYERGGKAVEQSDVLVRVAEAYQALGRYGKALEHFSIAQRLAVQAQDPVRQARILQGLGALALAAGQPTEAEPSLREALRLARELQNASLIAATQNSLGTLYVAQQRYADAMGAYSDSAGIAVSMQNSSLAARARINQAAAAIQMGQPAAAQAPLDQALGELEALPPSHDHAHALVTLGLTYEKLIAALPNARATLLSSAHRAYQTAAERADGIGDHRTASYAWGSLGRLYASEGRDQDALELTRRAVLSGQQAVAPDILYRWHWQAGRLFLRAGQREEALAAYRRAVFALQSVRSELIAASGPSAPSFRESAGGVYFELADLLLQRAATFSDRGQLEPYLKEARDVVESFKVDELRNYFGDECVDAARSRIATIEEVAITAAIIYPITLPDRLELLVSLPGGLQLVTVPVREERLSQEIRVFRQYLEKRTTRQYLPHGQQLYDWLIRPLEPLLAAKSVNTLVFVPDGALRTIPMAALHDGQQFLIQRYAVASTPGLTLTDPRPLNRQNTRVPVRASPLCPRSPRRCVP
jgi:tetratricopeptide (TPR) repeat protein